MEPHAVVQARPHERPVVPAHGVRRQDRVEETHVAGVGHHTGVQERVVGQAPVRADPQPLAGFAVALRAPRQLSDEALVDGVGALEPLVDVAPLAAHAFEERRDRLGIGHLGHGELVLEADLVGVEARLHVVDRPAVLDRDDSPRGETAPVADAVDLVEDGGRGVTRSQEVGVQRVDATAFDGASRRHERLGGDLTPEGALALLLGVLSAVGVDLDRLEVQQLYEIVQGGGHGDSLPAGHRRR